MFNDNSKAESLNLYNSLYLTFLFVTIYKTEGHTRFNFAIKPGIVAIKGSTSLFVKNAVCMDTRAYGLHVKKNPT